MVGYTTGTYFIYLNDTVYKSTRDYKQVSKIKAEIRKEFPYGKITSMRATDESYKPTVNLFNAPQRKQRKTRSSYFGVKLR
jgi:hypothetical protein